MAILISSSITKIGQEPRIETNHTDYSLAQRLTCYGLLGPMVLERL